MRNELLIPERQHNKLKDTMWNWGQKYNIEGGMYYYHILNGALWGFANKKDAEAFAEKWSKETK